MVETRGTEYMRMDFMSLKSLSTSRRSVVIQFVDPNGLVWFKEDVASDEWQAIAGAYQIPYYNTSLTSWPIPSDAPLGTWNFTCWDAAMTKILDTNLFTVIAKPTQQDVLDKLDECCDTIEDVITTSEGKIIAAVNTKTGTIMTDIAALEPQIQGITDTVVIIATMLGEVQVAIDDIDLGSMGVDIAAIKGDVATIKTNIGQVDVAVDSLDAVLGAVAGQCAEVQTTLGTLEGKIDSIQGNTATVITDVGAIQADITDVSGKVDMTPIWIAVVLSLVAAIAAIFAVITIRQKIAG
jgi:prefoldin subunit 5